MSDFDIGNNVINTQVPFFPSYTWELTESDFGNVQLWTFNWVQAFWDVTNFVGTPNLVVSTGERSASGNIIASLIRFAYSGQSIPIKGKIILATGTDRRGNTVTSIPIDAGSPTDSFSQVIVYGGNY